MESGGSFLVGSEGTASPLIRVPFTVPAAEVETPDSPAPTPVRPTTTAPADGNGFAGATWFWAVVAIALLAAISGAAVRKR
jgi:hypothetical protein